MSKPLVRLQIEVTHTERDTHIARVDRSRPNCCEHAATLLSREPEELNPTATIRNLHDHPDSFEAREDAEFTRERLAELQYEYLACN